MPLGARPVVSVRTKKGFNGVVPGSMRTSFSAGPHAPLPMTIAMRNGRTRLRVDVVTELTAFARPCAQSVRSLSNDL